MVYKYLILILVSVFIGVVSFNTMDGEGYLYHYAHRRLKTSQTPLELAKENIDGVIAGFGLELKIGQIKERLYSGNPLLGIDAHTLAAGIVLSIAKELPDYRDLDIKEWVKDNLGVDLNQKHLKAIDKVTDRLLEENERLFEEVKKVVANPEQIESLPEGTISNSAVVYQELGERKLTKDIVPGQPFEFTLSGRETTSGGGDMREIDFSFDGRKTSFILYTNYRNKVYKAELRNSQLIGSLEYKGFDFYGAHVTVVEFVVNDEFFEKFRCENVDINSKVDSIHFDAIKGIMIILRKKDVLVRTNM